MQIWIIIAMLAALMAGETYVPMGVSTGQADSNWPRSSAMVMGALLLMWSLLRIIGRYQLLRLKRWGWPHRKALRLPARIDLASHLLCLSVFIILLTVGGWAELVNSELRSRSLVGLWQFALIAPFVLMMLIKWMCFYPVNRHIREYIVLGHLAEGLAARPVWTMGQYVAFHLRHGVLIVLVPILLILSFRDVVEMAGYHWCGGWARIDLLIELTTMAGAGIIFLFSPFLLRKLWKTRSLPAGPLRDKLQRFCKHTGLRYRDLLLWDTYSAIANAAVMGLFGPVRYVLLTDSLIENMPDEQIEAVFGHEAGHIKYHHILFLVLFVIGSVLIGSLLLEGLLHGVEKIAGNTAAWNLYGDWIAAGLTTALFALWLLGFGWVSRRFERQADVHGAFSCRWIMDEEPLESNGDGLETLPGQPARIMAGALERIAFLNGISIHSQSWRHSSLVNRMAYLLSIADVPAAMARFHYHMRWIKITICFAVIVGISAWTWLMWSKETLVWI